MTYRKPHLFAVPVLLITHLAFIVQCSGAGLENVLWQAGERDAGNGEFALAPGDYTKFKEDGFFVVGQSEAKRDWPYAHPGPGDAWAGGRPHTFSIVFGLKQVPAQGECKLHIALVDTHSRANPELRISLNGKAQMHQTPPGGGDESIFGKASAGKPHTFTVSFPVEALKKGINEAAITTTSGSWMLYDWVGFESPAGTELDRVTGSTIADLSSPPVLVEREGGLKQVLDIVIRQFGGDQPATVKIPGLAETNLVLRAGSQTCSVLVPAVNSPAQVSAALVMDNKTVSEQALTLKPVRKWRVHLLPHSHVDIGYTHVQTDVERAQWKYLEMGIEAARKSSSYPMGCRFKWNVEVLWAVDSYLKQATPEKQREFFEAVRAGWVGLDALYGNELTGLCRPEELIRLLSFGADLSRRIGVPVQSAMITDVPGYTWGVVPAFAQAGVKYFSIGPNGGDRIGHTIAAWGDKPFWWVGPNGIDRVLVWMTGTGYYRVFQSPQMLHSYLAGLEAKGYPYDMVHVRHCLGDNGAPDVDFAETVKKWNETYAFPKLVISTTAEMFREFEQRYGDDLPTARGDFTPYWEDGAASSARETALNRASADRLTQTETLFALVNQEAYPKSEFEKAWRNVLLYDEHTWGAHNSISEPDAPFVKSQWAIKQANALDGDQQSRALLQQVANLSKEDAVKDAIDVFNTCSWTRTDLVTVSSDMHVGEVQVLDHKGKPVRSQLLSSGEIVFVAEKVAPFSARRFFLKPGNCSIPSSLKGEASGLSSRELSLRVDPETGAIASLYSKTLRRELADVQKGLNDYLYLPGSDLKGVKRNGKVSITVKEQGPVLASLLIESDAPGCRKLSREIRLVEGLGRIDIINVVDKLPIRAKEGVHFGFGFNVPGGQMLLDVPWAVVRPEADQIPGACKNWFTVQRWVDVANRDFGVTWATPDAPLVQLGGITANLIGSLADPSLWMSHIEPGQSIYSWSMNNHWHTNYRAEQEGPTVFRFSIWPHKPMEPDAATRFGTAVAQPLIPLPARGTSPAASRLKLDAPGVVVTALKPSEDGRALVVRLFAASGKAERVRLQWSEPAPVQTWVSDASEAPVSPLRGKLELPAYGVATVRAEFP